MTRETMIAALKQHPFLQHFGPVYIELLAGLAREVRFEKDEIIFQEGFVSQEFCLVTGGMIAIEIVNPGHTFRVQTLNGGDEFGWSALLDGHGTLFQSRALEASTAIAFDTHRLKAACVSNTDFGFALMQRMLGVVSERLQATRLQLLDMCSPAAHRGGM